MEEKTIAAFVRHMATTNGTKLNQRTNQTFPTKNQFPAFADFIRAICARTRAAKANQYDLIARELPVIAQTMDVSAFVGEDSDGRTPEVAIENALKYMSQGTKSGLVRPFVLWASKKDEAGLAEFMAAAGFINPVDQPAEVATPIFRPAGEQANSLYDLKNVFALAQQHIILIAQNHWHMASSRDTYWPLIEEALRRNVTVDLIAMHPDVGPEGGFLNRIERADQSQLPAHAVNMWTE